MEDGLGYPDHFRMLSYEGHRKYPAKNSASASPGGRLHRPDRRHTHARVTAMLQGLGCEKIVIE
jgi:hypothetical protein